MNFDAMAADMVHQANLVLANDTMIENNLPENFVPPIPQVAYFIQNTQPR